MSTTQRIAKNTLIQILGKAASTLLGLLAVAILARALGAEQFGWYSTAIGFLQFAAVLTDFGFIVVTAKMLAEAEANGDNGTTAPHRSMEPANEAPENKQLLFNNLFTWRLVTAVATQGLAVIAIWFFPYSSTIKIATLILALSFIPNILNQVFTGFYQTKLRMDIMMVGEIIGRVVLVAGLWFLARGNYGFMPMMWVVVIAAWMYTLYIWSKYRTVPDSAKLQPAPTLERVMPPQRHPRAIAGEKSERVGAGWSPLNTGGVALQIDKHISKSIFKKMWPVALGIIFNAFYLQGDRLILPLFVNAAEVGFYGVSYRVLDILSQVAFMTMGIMLPLLTFSWSRGHKEEFKKYYQMSFDLMLLVIVPMVVGTFVLASPILHLIAGPEYAPAAPLLALLSLAVFGICFGSTFHQISLAIDKQKQATWIFAIDAVLSVIAYFIFIPRYGAYGAAYVTIFSELFAGLGFFLLSAHYTKIWPKITTAFKIIAASLIMGVLLRYIQPLNIIVSIFIGIIIYAALALIFRIISWQTIKEIVSIRKSSGEVV